MPRITALIESESMMWPAVLSGLAKKPGSSRLFAPPLQCQKQASGPAMRRYVPRMLRSTPLFGVVRC
jgi:hypothetical protein